MTAPPLFHFVPARQHRDSYPVLFGGTFPTDEALDAIAAGDAVCVYAEAESPTGEAPLRWWLHLVVGAVASSAEGRLLWCRVTNGVPELAIEAGALWTVTPDLVCVIRATRP